MNTNKTRVLVAFVSAAVMGSVLIAPARAANPPTPPARVGGLVEGLSDATSADITWDIPDSYSLPIDKYVIRLSADGGYSWSIVADNVLTAAYTLDPLPAASARLVEVAAVSSDGQGEWSAPTMVTTKGTRQMRVAVQTSTGLPVTGGAITWEMVPRTVWSSITYGLTSDGIIDFPSAPAGTVKVTLVNGQLPDGTFVSGRWTATLGFASTVLTLPSIAPGVRRVHVTLPGGLPVANVKVSVEGLEQSAAVGRFVFAPPSGSAIGFTDATGLFTASGFANGTVQATITYDDGIIGQQKTVNLTGADTRVQLEYAPFVSADAPTATGSAGAGVNVALTASVAGAAALSLTPKSGQPGVNVTIIPPAGAAKGTCGYHLTGRTNARGKVTLRICATKSGVVRVKSAGALPVGSFTLLVRGRPSLPVRSVTAKSKSIGTISVSWARPFFTGGAPVLRYRVVVATPGKADVVRNVPVTSATTPLRRTVTSLLHAQRYVVSIYAITKYGVSDPVRVTVPVA